MLLCVVCLEILKSPVALPCGHVFCHGCIERIVNTIRPFTIQHCCPTCRSPYTIATIDPQFVPTHLRPYLASPIRRLYLDLEPHASENVAECVNLKAENLTLRANCEAWRRRAEVHSAANLGLVNLARMSRDHAVKFKAERDDLEQKLKQMVERYEDGTRLHTAAPPAPAPSCVAAESRALSEPQESSSSPVVRPRSPDTDPAESEPEPAAKRAKYSSHADSDTATARRQRKVLHVCV